MRAVAGGAGGSARDHAAATIWNRFAIALLLFAHALAGAATPATLTTIDSAFAARSDWNAAAPPADGWEPVPVPDLWNRRWHGFDGVVWYRLQWDEGQSLQNTGLLLEYLNMAGIVYVNDVLMSRDESLVEPLTRAWNVPRYWELAPPLLRAGRNTLLIRVSGLSEYTPGIGKVTLGPVATVRDMYDALRLKRHDALTYTFAINATLGCFFVILWLLSRREVAFGWYGLSALLWLGYQFNFISTSTGPFASNRTFAAVNGAFLLLFAGSFTMFVLRFCERRWPRVETVLWVLVALALALLFALPPERRDGVRIALMIAAGLLGLAANVLLLVLAWRGNEVEQRVLSATAVVYLIAGVHDLLVFRSVIIGNTYYADITAFTNTLCIAGVLAWRYTRNLNRIRSFNLQLQHEVDAARSELAGNLRREHEIEMAHARIGDRLTLVRDIHDSLGSSLLGSIAEVEHAPEKVSVASLLELLKDLRDELRLIVDSSIHESTDGSFAERLAPLRHRMTRLLDAVGIRCAWDTAGLDRLELPSNRTLDVLRFVQEALTNVLKHSGADRVEISLHCNADGLRVEVRDNGKGFGSDPGQGAGTRSMQARAQRLGGTWRSESTPGQTAVAIVGIPTTIQDRPIQNSPIQDSATQNHPI